MKIGFVGLGKLGLPCALAIESQGFEVKGFDLDPKISDYLFDRKIPYLEKDIDKYLENTNIEIYSIKYLVNWADLLMVTVQTPHEPEYEGITPLPKERKDFDYSYLKEAITTIIACANFEKDLYINIISTVLPGTLKREIFPLLKSRDRIHISYNPFFIAMGTTIHDFLNPEFILLGSNDEKAKDRISLFYKECLPGAKQFWCSIETAELIKVCYNTFISQKIVFINAVMELCEAVEANVDDVTKALSMANKRIISPMYLKGGMGDGGGCHPRDNIALSFIAQRKHLSADIWENLMITREKQTAWLADLILDHHRHNPQLEIWILGKAFKANTNLTVGSPALLLAYYLSQYGIEYTHFDPLVDKTFDSIDNKVTKEIESNFDVIYSVNYPMLVFIATNHDIFHNFIFAEGSIIIDPWRYLTEQDKVFYHYIGKPLKK